ncbi:LysE family translocator [Acetobacter senegalensis]|uniref:LysE family translocator n=1 Tax=Acetobacter senegalensis TaxID=446692 RepID=UPI001EDBE11D|nr:LysE family translocator [Acetobacter senegalensis]MCG4254338.1 LysE family translocator [Acetobacter senegalensis]
MSWHVWWVFSGIVFFLCAVPGPNMLHVLNRSAQVGIKQCTMTMAGCLSALVVVLSLSAAGLGAALAAAPRLFGVLRVAGALYLIYLGIKAWRGAGAVPEAASPSMQDGNGVADNTGVSLVPGEHGTHSGAETLSAAMANPHLSLRVLWRDGFFVGLSNPKLLLFATAFFPQFISPHEARVPQFLVLILTFLALELFWYSLYAFGGTSLSRMLQRPDLRKLFDRVTGVVFMGFGGVLLRGRL